MRDDILDAAEGIVRSRGLSELTVRSIAEQTHYGKSTVHGRIGSMEDLLDALADRLTDRHIATLSRLSGGADDTGDARFRATAEFIIETPELAAAMFGRRRPRQMISWSRRWLATFSRELLENLAANDEEALAEALYLSHRQIVTVISTIADSGDADFGARVLRETFQPFSTLARELEHQRSRGSRTDWMSTADAGLDRGDQAVEVLDGHRHR